MEKLHPIRKLGGKMVAGLNASSGSSSSTITTSSSTRKPLSNFVYSKRNSSLKSISTIDASSGSVESKHISLNSKVSLHGPESTYGAQASKLRGISNMEYSMKEGTKSKSPLHGRISSSNKSSVGSSYSLRCKLDSINSTAMVKDERGVKSKKASISVSILKMPERQIPDRNSSSKYQKKVAGAKFICREPESKGLGSTLSRKPLRSLNESRLLKNRVVTVEPQPRQTVAAGKLNSIVVGNKKITTERKIQNPKVSKPRGTHLLSRNGLSNSKVKSVEGKRETNVRSVVPRTYFR